MPLQINLTASEKAAIAAMTDSQLRVLTRAAARYERDGRLVPARLRAEADEATQVLRSRETA